LLCHELFHSPTVRDSQGIESECKNVGERATESDREMAREREQEREREREKERKGERKRDRKRETDTDGGC